MKVASSRVTTGRMVSWAVLSICSRTWMSCFSRCAGCVAGAERQGHALAHFAGHGRPHRENAAGKCVWYPDVWVHGEADFQLVARRRDQQILRIPAQVRIVAFHTSDRLRIGLGLRLNDKSPSHGLRMMRSRTSCQGAPAEVPASRASSRRSISSRCQSGSGNAAVSASIESHRSSINFRRSATGSARSSSGSRCLFIEPE